MPKMLIDIRFTRTPHLRGTYPRDRRRSMWRGIAIGVGVLVVLFGWSFVCFLVGATFQEKAAIRDGRASVAGSELVKSARQIFDDLLNPTNLDLVQVYLTVEMHKRVSTWLETYNSVKKRTK
jgi:hypothetical protein